MTLSVAAVRMGRCQVMLLLVMVMGLVPPSVLGHGCHSGFTHFYGHVCMSVRRAGQGVTWQQAHEECKQLGGDLAVIDSVELFQDISQHIDKNFPADLTVWVGASGRGPNWSWINGAPLSAQSSFWKPLSPSNLQSGTYYIQLTTKDQQGRRYLQDYSGTSVAPGILCQEALHHHH